jgi:hypothetical protein
MPEMTPRPQQPLAAFVPVAGALADDADFALGCECADPNLHIAHWDEEAAGAALGDPH